MKKIIFSLWNENFIGLLISAIAFCVYLTTMCRSVGFTDSGELAAVVCTLGIAHPTGYPLLTLLGRSWVMIALPLEEIIQLNILSALFTAIAVGLFFKTSLALHRSSMVFKLKLKKQKDTNDHHFVLASAIASLTLGFSTTFWSQSAAFEVYALHLVMILLAIWIFIAGLEEQLAEQYHTSRKLILSAFVLGLSFSNHMTTILLAPAFLWMYFYIFRFRRESFLRIIALSPFFLFGLSIYVYLFIRSAGYPLFDWGHPATFERFFWHISGKQFRVWMFSGWKVVQKQLEYYIANFTSEFHLVVIVCLAVGIALIYKQSRRLLAFLVFLFFTTIIYSINYDIFDIGPYFLLSYLVIGWIAVYGIDFIVHWASEKQRWLKIIIGLVLLSIPPLQIIYNLERVDQTTNKLPEEFMKEAFSKLEPNAVVLASQWDYFISPSYYYQFIRNERRDITVIDKSLLQNRSWYFLQLEKQAPWLIERNRADINLFLIELNKFEHDLPFNFNIIQTHWQNLLAGIVEESLHDHPVYIDARIEQEFPSNYLRTPSGLFLRLTGTEDTAYYRTAITAFSPWDRDPPVAKDFEQYYIVMLLRDADWLIRHGKAIAAKTVLTEVMRIDPNNYSAIWLMKQINS